jgi:hypothetical protein
MSFNPVPAKLTPEEWRTLMHMLPYPGRRLINVIEIMDNQPFKLSRFPGLPFPEGIDADMLEIGNNLQVVIRFDEDGDEVVYLARAEPK